MLKRDVKVLILLFFLVCAGTALYAQTRIMPLGDSITGSPGCWRALLWNRLQDNGFTNIDFVGTLGPQGCGIPYDGDNEGHGGALCTTVADQNQLVGWLSATNPDIVLMHFGTNDCWSNRNTTTIINAYSKLVDQMRDNNPNMKILVAQIIPMDPAQSCATCDVNVQNLNNAIPGWASSKTTSQSPIIVIDQWTNFYYSDTSDGVHPNDSGIQKISDKWYPALSSLLSGDPVNTPAPTSPPGVLPGDTNSSNTIDIVDALLIAQYYVGLSPAHFNSAAADVTRDGNIDIVDALRIAQCYVGIISCNF
ncbi:MAG: hypothetical protein JXJ04_17245 [Spirochaetales bacterium]|nr:hypothetical protein [Spirochaetales bacterium]